MAVVRLLLCAALAVTGVLSLPAQSSSDSDPPFNGLEDVTIYLYTQTNPKTPDILSIDDVSSENFDPKNPTRIVVHGGNSNAQKIEIFRDAYFATGKNFNIILVDWSSLSSVLNTIAAKSGVHVGDYVGNVANLLIEKRDLDPNNLIIIGHSMGGHVAGVIGNRIGGGLASEVVGLDPASVLFDDNPLEDQLDPTDAQFVQVIHTDGEGLGKYATMGDVDFYPNGGIVQPGCSDGVNCSHGRVIDFYLESITSRDFIGTKCTSYEEYTEGKCSSNEHAPMGEWSPHQISGLYYLNTNSVSPFAQGENDL